MKLSVAIFLLFNLFYFAFNFRLLTQKVQTSSKTSLSSQQKELSNNQMVESKNKKYFAKMQDDGNFVLYSSAAKNGKGKDNPTWASNTNGRGTGPYKCKMQEDGNLVVYDGSNRAQWASNTNGRGTKPYRTIMQDDGNLVLYDTNNNALWASNTMGKS